MVDRRPLVDLAGELVELPVGDGISGLQTDPVNILVYQPGGVAGPGVALTWAEVDAFANAAEIPWTLYCNNLPTQCEVPFDADTDFRALCTLTFVINVNDVHLYVVDGGKLRNLDQIVLGTVICEAITTSGVVFENSDGIVRLDKGGRVGNVFGTSLVPAVEITSVGSFVLVSLLSGGLSSDAGIPVCEVVDPNLFFIVPIAVNTNGGGPVWPDNTFISGAGVTVLSLHDGTGTIGSHSGILGTIVDVPIENAAYIGWQSGDTASRSITYTTGQPYFDTDLGIPIWWSGSAWVDATGASV